MKNQKTNIEEENVVGMRYVNEKREEKIGVHTKNPGKESKSE